MGFRFEKLDVWHEAVDFASVVYEVTRGFPAEERFGLTNQIRRASVSVSSNIAEGSGRTSDRDFARFCEVAYSSALEVVSQAHVAERQTFLPESERKRVYARADKVCRMLSGLRSSLLS